jgi:hypothetical protein
MACRSRSLAVILDCFLSQCWDFPLFITTIRQKARVLTIVGGKDFIFLKDFSPSRFCDVGVTNRMTLKLDSIYFEFFSVEDSIVKKVRKTTLLKTYYKAKNLKLKKR